MAEIYRRISTDTGKVSKLLSFIQNNEFIFGFGRADAWDDSFGLEIDDENPPFPTVKDREILNPILYKKASMVQPAVISSCGTLVLGECAEAQESGKKWSLLNIETPSNIETVYAVNPSNVFISVNLTDQDASIITGETENFVYRSLGLFTNPTYVEGVDRSRQVFLPSEIANPGVLHWVVNSTPQTIEDFECSTVSLIINF